MYWNTNVLSFCNAPVSININMRCIEIILWFDDGSNEYWLTLTWDVLK